jgi:hypothetical protein
VPKQGKLPSTSKKARKAIKVCEPVLLPLLDLFADVDEVFADEGAFDGAHLHKSLGRIYRSWLNTREALDPDFDRERYRNRMKKRPVRTGLTVPPVSGSRKRSTAPASISEKNRKKTVKPEKSSASPSVRRVRSDGSASRGR